MFLTCLQKISVLQYCITDLPFFPLYHFWDSLRTQTYFPSSLLSTRYATRLCPQAIFGVAHFILSFGKVTFDNNEFEIVKKKINQGYSIFELQNIFLLQNIGSQDILLGRMAPKSYLGM